MFLKSLVKLNNSVQNFASISGEDQKKVFVAFWIHLSPEFQISCCQVNITSLKTEGARHILPPSVLDPRGHHPPIINAYGHRLRPLQNQRLCS